MIGQYILIQHVPLRSMDPYKLLLTKPSSVSITFILLKSVFFVVFLAIQRRRRVREEPFSSGDG